jgi:hypothetical protein
MIPTPTAIWNLQRKHAVVLPDQLTPDQHYPNEGEGYLHGDSIFPPQPSIVVCRCKKSTCRQAEYCDLLKCIFALRTYYGISLIKPTENETISISHDT